MVHASPTAERAMPVDPVAIVRDFLRWTRSAPADARAQGARALARAYLDRDLDPVDHRDALLAMTALLDDRSPLVRTALAEILAPSAAAPRHLVTALAQDQPTIAAVVLGASPLLGDADLVDAVAVGDTVVQTAVARRADVPAGVSAALAEVGTCAACAVLCCNSGATITPGALARMVERHGADPDLRRAVSGRSDLHPGLRHDLVVATAAALAAFVSERSWLSSAGAARLTREATDRACLTIAASSDGSAADGGFAAHLLETGRLTPALLIRVVVSGDLGLFEAAISRLSGIPCARVSGLVRGGQTLGFEALYRKAGLPPALLPVFQAALFDADDLGTGVDAERRRIARALRVCAGSAHPQLARAAVLLRRLDAEALRDEARAFAREVEVEPDVAVALLPRLSPADRNWALRPAA